MKSLLVIFVACLLFGLPLQSSAQTDYSGSWYNPARNGEGFHIQLLDNGQALVIWFTYPGVSDDPATQQSWILGIGDFSGNTITVNDAVKASGPVFGDGYDKDDVNRITWGDISVSFSGPANGVVNYDGLDGAGSTNVTRITTLVGNGVESSLPDGVSGAWYDPETDGQGWFVEILSPSSALIYWFTYDANGNQAWNLGVGEIFDKEIILPVSLAGKGTRFGGEFNANDVVQVPFGLLKLRFDSCAAGRMSYLLTDGQTEGGFPLERLTTLAGRPCSTLPGPTQEQTVASNGSDPLATQYEGLDNIQVNLFGKKDRSGRVPRLGSGTVKTPIGNSILFTLDPAEPVIRIQDSESGITLNTELDQSGNVQIVLNDPANGISAAVGSETSGTSSAQSARSWLQSEGENKSKPETGEPGTAIVPVQLCGDAATTAQVNFLVSDGSSTIADIPATQVSPGQYQADIPNSLAPTLSDDVLNDVCATTAQQFASLCDIVSGDVLADPEAGSPDLCAQLGLQVGEIDPEASVNAAAVCSSVTSAFTSACAANALRGADCGPSPTKQYRDFSALQITARASAPGLLAMATSQPRTYDDPSRQLEFPTLEIQGAPFYISHSVSPSLPQAGDDFSIDLNVGCLNPGDQLGVTNQSNGSSSSCTVNSNGRCEATVSSQSGTDSNALEITGPGGFRHQLVQGLDNSSSTGGEGDQSGIWRTVIQGEIVEGIGFALSIQHPDAFLCQMEQGLDLSWDSALGIYNWIEFPELEPILGATMVGDEQMCLYIDDLIPTCLPAKRFSTWSEAAQDLGSECPAPSWLSN